MCGIAGIIAFDQRNYQVIEEDIESMLKLIAHRGPDGRGVYISSDKRIGLGHVRLSLVDLEGGQQPMYSFNRRVIVVYNGELYDYVILREELQKSGLKFKTKSDTEVLVNLYLKYGDDFTDYLDGEFSFCLYDNYKNKLFVVRDHFGIKPLYYNVSDGVLTFCSEVKGIYGNRFIPRKMNFNVVTEQLLRIDNGSETIFDSINILPPGHMLIIKDNTIIEKTYWDIDYPVDNNRNFSEKSIEENALMIRQGLENAIRRRMQSDVEIGCFLSGGLDSSVIASVMQKYSANKIKTFSISFENPKYDESIFASEVANFIGSEFHKVVVTSKDIIDYFPVTNFHCEHTVQQPDGVGKYLLSKYASGFVKSVLVGEGADEVLLGYPWFKTLKLLNYHDKKRREQLLNIIKQRETADKGLDLTISDIDIAERDKLKQRLGYYPISWDNVYEMKKFSTDILSDDYKEYALKNDFSYSYFSDLDLNRIQGRNILHQNAYEFFKKTFHVYLMQYLGGKSEMANSLESRLPFLDKTFFDLCKNISPMQHLFGLTEKNLLRRAFKDRLPKNIVTRTKHGYSASILEPFFKYKPDYFTYYLGESAVKRIGFFNYEKVNEILKLCRNSSLDEQTRILFERSIIFVLSVQILYDSYVTNFPDGEFIKGMA